MYLKNFAIAVACYLFTISPSLGQSKTDGTELKIGDKVPDVLLGKFIANYPSDSARLFDLKAKLTIIDFWGTFCTPCIMEFPKLDSLQKAYKDKLMVLSVCSEEESRVRSSFKNNPLVNQASFPILSGGTLDKMFPHRSISHCVWIDSNRIVKAITLPEHVNKKNIQSYFDGESIVLPLKDDDMKFDRNKPLFLDGNGGNGASIIYRSLFSSHLDGHGTGPSGVVKEVQRGLYTRIAHFNHSVLYLYKIAYGVSLFDNRAVLDVESPQKLTASDTTDLETWEKKNTFCYELIIPPSPMSICHERMQYDLIHFFGYKLTKEKRKIKVLVLKVHSSKKIQYSRIDEQVKYPYTWAGETHVTASSITDITMNLNAYMHIPVIDETNINRKINLMLPANYQNIAISSLQQSLRKQGFDLLEEEREMDVFVISNVGKITSR